MVFAFPYTIAARKPAIALFATLQTLLWTGVWAQSRRQGCVLGVVTFLSVRVSSRSVVSNFQGNSLGLVKLETKIAHPQRTF
ncbi:hypothetical protein OF83DRAFT_1137481, partial [Amylostereum chailletii]